MTPPKPKSGNLSRSKKKRDFLECGDPVNIVSGMLAGRSGVFVGVDLANTEYDSTAVMVVIEDRDEKSKDFGSIMRCLAASARKAR